MFALACTFLLFRSAEADPGAWRSAVVESEQRRGQPPPGYRVVFSDDFDGDSLDRDKWCTRYIYGGGAKPQVHDPACHKNGEGTLDHLNDERQRYVDINARGVPLHQVDGGMLTLTATRTGSDKRFAYESAMVRSKALFRPSADHALYITARVRLPSIKGTWPAFWLNSDRDRNGKLSWPPEIDIFEAVLNAKEDRANMLHMGAAPGDYQEKTITFAHGAFHRRHRNLVASHSLRDRWLHTSIEWKESSVCYFVEGVKVMCEEYRWIRKNGRLAPPAHILLNLAIGGEWAGRHGIDDARFPASFFIDYVRVYSKNLAASGAAPVSENQ